MGRSTGVNISDAIIKTGDDSLSIGDGSQHINVEKVTCGPGHGISVGSLGKYHNEEPVVGVTVKNCTLINTMNGIRVKTWPDSPASVATDLHFEDIIMNNVGNPILINQEYCPYDQCQAKVPSQVKISDVSFQGICSMSGTFYQTKKRETENIGMKLNIAAISLLLLLTSVAEVSGDTYFDVTKYGAQADGKTDISQALLTAWEAACASPIASRVVIPAGIYALGQVTIEGPCKAPINLIVKGTVRAPVDTSRFKPQAGWVAFQHLDQFTLSGYGVFDGQGQSVWGQKCSRTKYCHQLPINLRFNFLTNSIIKDITSKDSKQFHINVLGCRNITFFQVAITAPEDSQNTDGIHIGRSRGVNITHSTIQTGDDCVSIGDGSEQIDITKVNCGPGHGISVGSLGLYKNEAPVIGIRVKNCTLSDTTNGVRVKTWPSSPQGTATEMHFHDIVMNNVSNPIIIDQEYCPHNQCNLQMLQRIYGTAWENEEQLKAYLHFKEEAKRRDHRRLGIDLDLFSIQDEAGGGLVFWHPKGAILKILSVEPSLLHKIEHHFKNAKCLSSNWMGIRVPAKLPMVLIFEDLYTWNVFLYLFLDS
uniref:Polygalacturonase n=1 Tax=Vitis vinifera TaxID=29760 RepID=F6HHK3_VITVI